MKIGIVGGGIYGCHIAATLKSLGVEVDLFEARERLLEGASGNNQFRLHQGFHYARSFSTRVQSRDGYHRFKERYSRFSRPVLRNLYGVVEKESYLDFRTYRGIMSGSGLDFADVSPSEFDLLGIEGMISTSEEVLQISNLRKYFTDLLSDEVHLGMKANVEDIVNSREFDWVIDCTWGHAGLTNDYFFEPTLLLYYECLDPELFDWSITLVDGSFWSLYQTEEPSIFTLSSVRHTPLGRFDNSTLALKRISDISSDELKSKRKQFEQQALRMFPTLLERFSYRDVQLSVKTKPVGMADHRNCEVWRDGNIIRILSGKIDNIFYASEHVLAHIEQGNHDGR